MSNLPASQRPGDGPVSPVLRPLSVGLVVPTTGRWAWVEELLDSARSSSISISAVVIANQSGSPAPDSIRHDPVVEVVDSQGGISAGRNDGLRALGGAVDVIGLPNDHSRLRIDTVATVLRYFEPPDAPSIVAGTLLEPGGPRLALPPAGTRLNRRTVWRAIEPATFITAEVGRMGFRVGIGAGSDSVWQAGEGTDLFLRAMSEGHRIVSAPDVVMLGRGERRGLSDDELRIKLRSYARGTGYVLRLNRAGPIESALFVLSPLWRLVVPPPSGVRQTPRVTQQSVLGRVEGRFGRCVPNGITRLSPESLRK
jgi:hypothetical protein